MNLSSALLTIALSLPPPWQSTEPPAQYRARLTTIADAIADVAPDRTWAAVLLAVVYGESRFRRSVHAGEKLGDCHRGTCRAICLAQLHRNGRSEAEWRALAGTSPEATKRCVRAAYEALRRAQNWCRARHGTAGIAEALSLYGTGSTCRSPRGRVRARMARRLEALLRSEG